MKSFSPAGMATKALFGGPGWPFGGANTFRQGQSGAQTFGNPNGALSGGGGFGGGANPDGPNQGGFVPGGGPSPNPFTGTFVLHAVGVAGFTVGYADGMFASDPFHNGGSVLPTSLNGCAIGALWEQYNVGSLFFGMYKSHLQNDFNTLAFIDQFGNQQLFDSATAVFTDETQASPPAPSNVGASWRWATPAIQLFAFNTDYTIYINQLPPASFTVHAGIASTGPLGPPYGGDGTGFYLGTLNGGFGCGSATPASPTAFGNQVIVCGWGGSAPYGGQFFCLCLQGTHPQNLFTEIILGAPVGLSFMNPSTDYSTTDYPGYTIWTWSDPDEFSHIGATFTVQIIP